MKRNRYLLAAALSTAAVAVGAAASAMPGDAATLHAKAAAKPALKVTSVSITVGSKTVKQSVLVNSSGHAVYLLTGDTTKHPECATASCLGSWPAVTSSSKKPVVSSSVKGKVAVWHHNGMNQLTINGHPLYTFAGDSSAGVAKGQGLVSFGGTWKVLAPSGSAAAIASSSSSGGSGAGGGSGSGW